MPPRYPLPWNELPAWLVDLFLMRQRSFAQDARRCVEVLSPPCIVTGLQNIPEQGGFVMTVNHYSRPGFRAWWLALAASAYLPGEVRWIMTNAWRFTDSLRHRLFTPLTRRVFIRIAHMYQFFLMPPMPPQRGEEQQRATSVRQVLSYVKVHPDAVIGLAPEGQDHPGGQLHLPPSGVGRFIAKLVELGLMILPVGFYEEGEHACLHFGAPYTLCASGKSLKKEDELFVARKVMQHIAACLPSNLRGEFDHGGMS